MTFLSAPSALFLWHSSGRVLSSFVIWLTLWVNLGAREDRFSTHITGPCFVFFETMGHQNTPLETGEGCPSRRLKWPIEQESTSKSAAIGHADTIGGWLT